MKAVVSIGNPIKSDDNIGNVVLDMIETDAVKIKAQTMPENFINVLKDYDRIIILDALQFDGEVGDVRSFDLDEVSDRLMSTHSIPIATLKNFLPNAKISVIGIQPQSMDFSEELTDGMKERLDEIKKNVESLINSL